jgi:hypothetical protein
LEKYVHKMAKVPSFQSCKTRAVKDLLAQKEQATELEQRDRVAQTEARRKRSAS